MKLLNENKEVGFLPTLISDLLDNDSIFSPTGLQLELHKKLPAVNIRESGKEFNIEFAVPGFDKKDFHIEIQNSLMTVLAKKEVEKTEENEHFTRKEFSLNSFNRSFTLPKNVDTDKVHAEYIDGILKVRMQKKEEEKAIPSKEIKIK
ncbi:Hsp20/alpha crystallin family protein [Arthrospiribacter ruber]|uniref:Hsp20/alpha crystallin family protein n=1 Tax=Arthrospiribacter ruber TaxID=2487934 RepID=A0A951J239_9BACT|nr:Hsp20/alpha crystallin family protein [Arthrospiribacter ruber]MBW3469538.1 Hsp20/alpha crystallin family protein [Arthrospiribacter ruber]